MAQPVVLAKPVVAADPLVGTNKVSVTLRGRDYYVTCDPTEEERLASLVSFVEARLNDIASKNPGLTETRLFMMACLLLADDLMEAKRQANEGARDEEELMVAAVDHLRARVAQLAQQIGSA
jgi:cell division protein ZapA